MGDFNSTEFELGKITITDLAKQTYYASVDGDTVKIYTKAPAIQAQVQAQSLFDIVTDAVTNYELCNDPTPDNAVQFYVITENLDDCGDFKISDKSDMYVLPSLTPERIEKKIAENKHAADQKADSLTTTNKQEVDSVTTTNDQKEADRLAAAAAEKEADRLAAAAAEKEAERVKAENNAYKERLAKIHADRKNNCNSYLKDGNILIESKPIDYECFTYFQNISKIKLIKLINVTNIENFFYNIHKLTSIEEIEIISNDPKEVLTFATKFNEIITEKNISYLLNAFTKLKRIKLEYMIDTKKANIFLNVLNVLKENITPLESVSICPSSDYFNTMRTKFKNTNSSYIYKFINEKTNTEIELKKIQEDIDNLLLSNQEAERLAADQEAERLAAEQEAERLAAEQEAERLRLENERIASEKEAERIKLDNEKIAAEQEAERVAAEKIAAAEKEAEQLISNPTYEVNNDGTPKINIFTGGTNVEISNKIQTFYSKIHWVGNTTDANNEFLYINDSTNAQVIAVVRINNKDKELDYDYVDESFRKKGLYDKLLKARLNYILENKKEMYVLYTDVEYLKKSHIKNGMTLISDTQVSVAGDTKKYWKFEYNRNPRTLVTKTGFNGGMCSGIAIGNDSTKEYIYTATHCLKTPGVKDELPISVMHPKITGIKTQFFTENSVIRYKLPVPDSEVVNTIKYFIEYADDIAIFNTTLLMDTTNIFLIDNCEEIPEYTKLQYWGSINNDWRESTLVDNNDIITNAVNTDVLGKDFDNVYPEWKTVLGDGHIQYNYKKMFRLIGESPSSGNSGGPHGFFFNRKTGIINNNQICFAICFTTGSKMSIGDESNSTDYGVVISASRWIDWLKGLGVKINTAHYNVNNTISILPSNTISGESGSNQKPGGGSGKTQKTHTKFRVSRRKQIKKTSSI
jgi:predicted GNAT family acetyltransferase